MKKFILSLLVVITTIPLIFGQKENLKFNLKVGETYSHLIESSSIINQDLNGQKINIDVNVSCKTDFKVTNIKDNVCEMTVSYEYLEMTMNLPNKSISFSSDKEDNNDVLSNVFKVLKGKQFFMKMTNVGKIIEVKKLDSLIDALVLQFPDLNLGKRQQVKTQILQSYGEKAFIGSYEMITNIYTNVPVQKGNTWTINTKLQSGLAANLITTYTLKNKTEKYNLLTGNGKFVTLSKNIYTQKNGMDTRYNLTGTYNATLKVDVKSGWVLEAKVTQLMKGNAEVKANKDFPDGLKIPLSIKNSIRFNLK